MKSSAELVREVVQGAEGTAQGLADRLSDESPSVEAYVEYGVPLSAGAAASQNGMDEIAAWVEEPRAQPGSKALVDVTSLVTFDELLDGKKLTPLTLWDLSRMVSAIVSHDSLFHFESPEVDDASLNSLLGGTIFRTIPLPSEGPLYDPVGVRGLWNDAWGGADSFMRRLEEEAGQDTISGRLLDALALQWSTATGVPLSVQEVADATDSNHAWSSPGGVLLAQLWSVSRVCSRNLDNSEYLIRTLGEDPELADEQPRFKSSLVRTVRECNYRGLVNQRLANHLGLPYLPNTARLPFRDRVIDVPRMFSDELPAIVASDDEYMSAANRVQTLKSDPFVVPVFLALALLKAKGPADLWDAVAELREEAAPFRRRRADLDDALALGDRDTTAELLRALRLESKALTDRAVEASGAAADALVTSVEANPVALLALQPVEWLTTAITAVVAGSRKLLPSEVSRRLMWRFFKPEFRYLNNLMQESRAITDAMPRVQRLWGVPDSEAVVFAERFASFGALVKA